MKNLTRDQFAKFMFEQFDIIKSYKFDILHDISKIINFAYDLENQKFSDAPIKKTFVFLVRESGTYLIDAENVEFISDCKKVFNNLFEYKITICSNCDYFYNETFAQIEETI